jgi:hypothetical protein
LNTKHLNEECKVKLEAIWSIAQRIKLESKDGADHSSIALLTELIQQDTTYLARELTK